MRRWAFGCLMVVLGMTLGLLLALWAIYWVTVLYTSSTPSPPPRPPHHTRTVSPRPAGGDVRPVAPEPGALTP